MDREACRGEGCCGETPDDASAGGGCCGAPRVGRRQFLRIAGAGVAATSLGRPLTVMAGAFAAEDVTGCHLVPADKQLDPDWVRSLFERGAKEVFRGKALDKIGMPCGGIGAGQLYLCGDGTLGSWQIFNDAVSNWVEGTSATYKHEGIAKPVEQGFAVVVRDASGDAREARLEKSGFPDTEFHGEYPIGRVRYRGGALPVEVDLEAFSPFIPLNARDSGLPATVFHFTVTNPTDAPVTAALFGWLENAVCRNTGGGHQGTRISKVCCERDRRVLVHAAAPCPHAETAPPTVFADLEGEDYGDWTVEGDAFGSGPVSGTLPNQSPVTGYQGDKLVNTYLNGDRTTGTLTSPEFTIERPFINLLVGGGHYDGAIGQGETGVKLVVDGETIETARGRTSEELQWESWHVGDRIGRKARIVVVDTAVGGWGHILCDQIEFADAPRTDIPLAIERAPDYGTMALATPDVGALQSECPSVLDGQQLVVDGVAEFGLTEQRIGLVQTADVQLGPGASYTFTFVLAWHFPNNFHDWGHAYAAWFPDAPTVAHYVLDEHERLTHDTRLWRDTWYDGTLPYWLLDRLHSTVSTLATGTCHWWRNGRFYAYEGVTCCEGTCTHVWNYAHAHARLFPELARSVREMQDFCPRDQGGGFHPDTGLVGFRSNDAYAADGQCGTILKAYREHLCSADAAFLFRFWPRIRKALEFCIAQDANSDGLIENLQHNTYDINYYGANTFVGALYLAALRAGEEMAREVGEEAFANHVHAIYIEGRRRTVERLWNGEYFEQDVDLDQHTQHQYKDGCLSDHLFGQGWAHQVGLGYLYPEDHVRTALRAVWKCNWTPDVGPYNEEHAPLRWFITPGQAGLFTCTWPKGAYLPNGTMYKNEVWTGIEYQVAGHMAWEGLLTEALAICRAVHDRYHPELFNPYNEVECGDHYARAMASWGVLTGLAGFCYHGPKGVIGFAPRITPENFKAAFTAAEGWGAIVQQRDETRQWNQVHVRWGRVRIAEMALELPGDVPPSDVEIALLGEDGRTPDALLGGRARVDGRSVTITLNEPVVVEAGRSLGVAMTF